MWKYEAGDVKNGVIEVRKVAPWFNSSVFKHSDTAMSELVILAINVSVHAMSAAFERGEFTMYMWNERGGNMRNEMGCAFVSSKTQKSIVDMRQRRNLLVYVRWVVVALNCCNIRFFKKNLCALLACVVARSSGTEVDKYELSYDTEWQLYCYS